jgi:hypothetical protein
MYLDVRHADSIGRCIGAETMRTLNINECAEFLKINVTTASELAAGGTLPGAKIGRAWVFLEDDLVDYLRAEVRRQQGLRRGTQSEPESAKSLTRVDQVATFPAVRRKRRQTRSPLPDLSKYFPPETQRDET